MTLAEFKKANNIETLPMWKSTKSDRMVGSFAGSNGVEIMVVTKEDFNDNADAYVYQHPESAEPCYIISNKAPRKADLVL